MLANGICETPVGTNVFGGASNRSPKGLDETPQCVINEGRLKPPFAGNVGIPLAGARRLISRPRKASIFHLRRSKGVPLGYDFGHVELAYKTGIEAAHTMIDLCIKKCFSDEHIIVCSKRGGKRIASF